MKSNKTQDGHLYYRFPNGNIQIVGNYSKGKKDGYFEEFYENGELKTLPFYKDDLLNGYVEDFNEEGISISIEKYELGVKLNRI